MHSLLDLDARPVVAHRGASGSAPENTVEAFQLALDQGADAVEFDVRLSGDGVLMVLHDAALPRTTNLDAPIATLSAQRIAEADAGFRFSLDQGNTWPWRDRGVRVPTVERVLEQFPEVQLLIEVKETAAAEPLAGLLRKHGARERVVVASFLEEALRPFYADPGFRTGASRKGILRLWLSSISGIPAPRSRYSVYAVPDRYRDRIEVPRARFIRAARRRGCPVHVWTVNDPSRAAMLWRRGAAGMITNYPADLLAERSREG